MFILVGRSLTKATIENANKKYEFNVNSSSCPYDVCKSRYLRCLLAKPQLFEPNSSQYPKQSYQRANLLMNYDMHSQLFQSAAMAWSVASFRRLTFMRCQMNSVVILHITTNCTSGEDICTAVCPSSRAMPGSSHDQ